MSQFDFGTIDPYVVDGVQLADMLNQWRDAIHSMHRGGTRPAYVVPGMMWINDSAGPTSWVVNVYFSPTVGDKPLFTYDTTTGSITVSASAGGTLAAAVLLAQAAASPEVQWNSTANPIDQKKWRSIVTSTGALRFSAYNDAGVETSWVQFNRDGTTTTSPAAPKTLSLYSDMVLGAAAGTIDVTIPAGTKYVELQWLTNNTSLTAGDLRIVANVSGVPNLGAIYNQFGTYVVSSAPTTAAAFTSTSVTSINLSAAATQSSGFMQFRNLGTTWYFTAGYYNYTTVAQHVTASGFFTLAGVTGFRLLNSGASPTFIVGSFLRAYVVF